MAEPLRFHDETLTGRSVRLEPLGRQHLPGLLAAAQEDRASFGLTLVPASEAEMARYIDESLAHRAEGLTAAYATVRSDGRVVGSTRFANAERWQFADGSRRPDDLPDAVEIGWTWLAASAQRTSVNTEAKLLMLGFAFERWQVHRVTLKTDVRNLRSRANIERIGGKLDGILRAHMPAYDGGIRDSAWYSIVAAEWPALRERLSARLERSA